MSHARIFRDFKTSPEIIRLAVMLDVRYPPSLRNVEDLPHDRRIDVTHETVRFWWNRFGTIVAAEIKRSRAQAMRHLRHRRWHLDEAFVKISGGEALPVASGRPRRRGAGKLRDEAPGQEGSVDPKGCEANFLRKSLKRHGATETIVTDRLASYGAALKALGATDKRNVGRWLNNRVENSHQPFRRRERAMLRFRRMRSLQKFAAVHGSLHNPFNAGRHHTSRQIFRDRRAGALTRWRQLCAV
jgi:putative transposase